MSSEGVPDFLITRDQSDRRGDGEVVKDLYSLLVANRGRAGRELLDVILQFAAEGVIVKSHSEAVIGPAIEKPMGKQGDAPMGSDRK